MEFYLTPLGDSAVIIELGKEITIETHQKVRRVADGLEMTSFSWMIEHVPAFTTVTLFYNPLQVVNQEDYQPHTLPYEYVCSQIEWFFDRLTGKETSSEARIIEIPVLYGGELGPDLEYVAEHNQLTPQEVIDIHTSAEYLVYMIGFAPGFPYLGGMSKKIAAPRRNSPRTRIPSGSVGIAGEQTGIYPIETPGGWQLIGRTPIKLFRPEEDTPSLLQAGDKIRFKAIGEEEYRQREDKQK